MYQQTDSLEQTFLPIASGAEDQPLADSSAAARPASGWTDWFGIVASIGCAIHCAAMPFLIAFLPAMGLTFLADQSFHKVMAIACALLAIAAFVPGWRKHRRLLPAGVAAAGLMLITTAAFAMEDECCAACAAPEELQQAKAVPEKACCEHCVREHAEPVTITAAPPPATGTLAGLFPFVTPLGGVLLVSAHLTNRRFLCRCGCCPADSVGESDDSMSEVA